MSNPITLLLRGIIHAYRFCLAPLLPGQCRFLPTCSHYGLEALQLHGPVHGSWLTLRRLLRCHPWGGQGFDPVPRTALHDLARRQPAYKIDKATPHV